VARTHPKPNEKLIIRVEPIVQVELDQLPFNRERIGAVLLSCLTAETGQRRRVRPHTRSNLEEAAHRKTAQPSGFIADVEDRLATSEKHIVGEQGEATSRGGWPLNQDWTGSAEKKAHCDRQFQ
jgi:hypothetical protein